MRSNVNIGVGFDNLMYVIQDSQLSIKKPLLFDSGLIMIKFYIFSLV